MKLLKIKDDRLGRYVDNATSVYAHVVAGHIFTKSEQPLIEKTLCDNILTAGEWKGEIEGAMACYSIARKRLEIPSVEAIKRNPFIYAPNPRTLRTMLKFNTFHEIGHALQGKNGRYLKTPIYMDLNKSTQDCVEVLTESAALAVGLKTHKGAFLDFDDGNLTNNTPMPVLKKAFARTLNVHLPDGAFFGPNHAPDFVDTISFLKTENLSFADAFRETTVLGKNKIDMKKYPVKMANVTLKDCHEFIEQINDL
ncbi:MAG: hypothetical protein LBG88_02890 [Christensenellaceae bacterium]|jgi:hypothetical protein|nr:hypothetical protein [Christensenellaceae bacterium]